MMNAFPRRARRLVLAYWLCLLCATAAAQQGVAESQQHLRDANAARAAGDYAAFTRSLEIAHRLNPESLYTRYNLARGYAHTAQADKAIGMLEWLTRARVDFGMADDPAFAALAGDERFAALVAELAVNTRPQVSSTLRFSIPRLDLIPEGISWDAAGERLFIGSMRSGDIFEVDSEGHYTKFASVSDDTPLAAIGLAIDSERRILWAIGTGSFLVDGFDPDGPVVSGVFGFDLASGERLHAYTRDDVDFGYNDVAVAPNGDLYLSGSTIGFLPRDGDAIQTLATSEPVFGSNGILVTPDGATLITSSYPAGIAVIRLRDGETNFLRAPDNVALYGIDGMYLYKGDLIAVQHGARPWRLMRFALNAGRSAITKATVLELGDERLTATTGAIAGDRIHLVGQGPVTESPPGHVPENLWEFLGPTVVVTAPLD
jgi:hypothetical protein